MGAFRAVLHLIHSFNQVIAIIAKNQLAREKLIIYNSEGNYNIIDSVDTEYIEKTSAVPNLSLIHI